MLTEYEYIHFTQIGSTSKTTIWSCVNNKSSAVLGIVKWNSSWRQYCFFPESLTVFSNGCLADIQDFIKQLKKQTIINEVI